MLCAKFGWNWSSGFWEEDKRCQCNFTILLLSPLRKGNGPSFEQTLIPFTLGCFVPSLVKIGPLFPEKKFKMCKTYRRTDRGQTKTQKMTLTSVIQFLIFRMARPLPALQKRDREILLKHSDYDRKRTTNTNFGSALCGSRYSVHVPIICMIPRWHSGEHDTLTRLEKIIFINIIF